VYGAVTDFAAIRPDTSLSCPLSKTLEFRIKPHRLDSRKPSLIVESLREGFSMDCFVAKDSVVDVLLKNKKFQDRFGQVIQKLYQQQHQILHSFLTSTKAWNLGKLRLQH
jgi:hypothetical protein